MHNSYALKTVLNAIKVFLSDMGIIDNFENLNALLAAVVLSYAIPIGFVWNGYKNQKATSISEIVCKNKLWLMCSVAVMSLTTLLYEHLRIKHAASTENIYLHNYGFACIVTLSFCILSLILFDKPYSVHLMFAIVGFCAMVGYTFAHFALVQTPMCAAVLATQFASCANITHCHGTHGDIFWGEVIFVLTFSIFYLYLHWNYNNYPDKNRESIKNNNQRILDSAAICSSVSDVGRSMENRILSAPFSL